MARREVIDCDGCGAAGIKGEGPIEIVTSRYDLCTRCKAALLDYASASDWKLTRQEAMDFIANRRTRREYDPT